jgi:hypothetical protein
LFSHEPSFLFCQADCTATTSEEGQKAAETAPFGMFMFSKPMAKDESVALF